MRIRLLTPLIAVSVVACAAETADETAVAEEPQEYATEVDHGAALAALAADWQTHYNMGHGSMVADYFVDDALMWDADGSMAFGKAAIAAKLQGEIEMMSPQVSITHADEVVVGDYAMSRGTYSVSGSADGAELALSGYWTSLSQNVDGTWRLHGLVGNHDASEQMIPPMEGMPEAEMPAPEASASMVAEAVEYYETHFNMGHGGMVAENAYTADAIVMGSGQEMISGTAAITERLNEMVGAQLDIVPLAAHDLGEGNVAGIGTYTLEGTPDGTVNGHYSALWERQDDGSLKLKWLLTSNHPAM